MKRFLSILLTLTMVIGLGVSALAVAGDTFTYTGADATNNGQITVTNATNGKDYTLYKIFDATYDAEDATKVSYTIKNTTSDNDLYDYLKNNGQPYFTIGATPDKDGNYSVTRTGTITNGTFTPTKTDAELIEFLSSATIKALYTQIGTLTSPVDGQITFDKIPYGYYFLTSSLGTVITIDTNKPTESVIDKNQDISIEKNIVDGQDDTTTADVDESLVKVNEAGLNEDNNYIVKVNATNYDHEKKVYKYIISDNIDLGMTFKAGTAPVVKVDGTALTSDKYTVTYYTDNTKTNVVATTNLATAQYFEIVIPWTDNGAWTGNHLYPVNSTITVEYTAFLDPNKREQLVVGTTTPQNGNTNEAQVKWYSDIDETPPETPNGSKPPVYTDTFTTQLTVIKQDQNQKALKGAEFTLTGPTGAVVITRTDSYELDNTNGTHWKLNDGTYTTQDPNGTINGSPVDQTAYASTTDKYKLTSTYATVGSGQENTEIKVTVGDDGKATFIGLSAGEYTLKESIVPAGYNRAPDISFTITATTSDDTTTQTGKKITFASNNSLISLDQANNIFDTIVVNQSGTELPSTGGIGTTIFYIIGGLLAVGAGVVLVTKKRMGKEEN